MRVSEVFNVVQKEMEVMEKIGREEEMESKYGPGRIRLRIVSLIFHGRGLGVYDSQGSLHNRLQKRLRAL